jgi:hypothetical protein
MKTKFTLTAFVLVGCGALVARSAEVEKVQFNNKRILAWQGGLIVEPTNEVALPFEIVVQTNGAFTVKAGKVRQLNEGDILDKEGMLLGADGSIKPVLDHVSSDRGRIVVVKDGETVPVRGTMTLGDGTIVSEDRKITSPAGSYRWLMDGELFRTEGKALPTRDTVTLQDGRVKVQKDGALLAIDPARSIMMNDGTKVLGDGTVIRFDGERLILNEGEVLVIEGVVRKK